MKIALVIALLIIGEFSHALCANSESRTISGRFEIVSITAPKLQCFKNLKLRNEPYEAKVPGCVVEVRYLGIPERSGDASIKFKYFVSGAKCSFEVGQKLELTLTNIEFGCCADAEKRRGNYRLALCEDLQSDKVDSMPFQCYFDTNWQVRNLK